MGWFDWFPGNPLPDWSALSMQAYVGILGFVALLVGGILVTRATRVTLIVGLMLLAGGAAALAWALGLF